MQPVSIFDMDRTLTRGGTWLPWLLFWVRREAPWRLALLPLLGVVALAQTAGGMSRGQLKEIAQRLMMGRNVAREQVTAAADAYAEGVASSEVFAGAIAQLAADRAEGRRLVVATASNAFYARAIARRLGVTDVVATESVWDGDQLCPRLAGPNCYGAAKRAQVAAWLAREGLGGADIRFYSDHISDLPTFELAREAVAANPSAALRALAVARGWRIVDWGTPGGSWFERA